MSELIFVVVVSGGEYDNAWEQNLCAYCSRDAAEAEVAQLEAFQAKVRPLAGAIKDAAYAVLRNRPTMLPTPSPPAAPKLANKEEEASYRQARAVWQAEVQPIVAENTARLEANVQLARQVAVNKAADLGLTAEDMSTFCLDDPVKWLGNITDSTEVSYHIEELELR